MNNGESISNGIINSSEAVQLREVEASDLALFFEYQLDPEAN